MHPARIIRVAGLTALLAISSAALAQEQDEHAGHTVEKTVEKKVIKRIERKGEEHADHAAHMGHDMAELPGAGAAIEAYRDALVALDLEAAGAVFAEDALVFENGKAEGTWANYAQHHLGPELGHFHSFSFPTYELEIRQEGHHAFGVERYTYNIELHDGRVIEREGVATSVLKHGKNGWKIASYHSSSRAPKK